MLTKYIILIVIFCSTLFGFSQANRPVSDSVLIDGVMYNLIEEGKSFFAIKNNGDSLFYMSEKIAEFPGGQNNLLQFLAKNIKYPYDAKKNNISGKVYLNFIIDNLGDIQQINIIKGVHPLLDNEALRVIKSMPRWTPAEHNGGKIAMIYNLPINFILKNTTSYKSLPSGPSLRTTKSYNKGNKFFTKKDFAKAVTHYTEAIKWYPNYKNAYYQRASCYVQLRNLTKACEDWNKCAELGDVRVKKSINKHCK